MWLDIAKHCQSGSLCQPKTTSVSSRIVGAVACYATQAVAVEERGFSRARFLRDPKVLRIQPKRCVPPKSMAKAFT
jgi:hypothetical protein